MRQEKTWSALAAYMNLVSFAIVQLSTSVHVDMASRLPMWEQVRNKATRTCPRRCDGGPPPCVRLEKAIDHWALEMHGQRSRGQNEA